MKIHENTVPSVQSVGDNQTHQFQIKASHKAFHILSKGIYGDSITPPIRELATNAWDSHIEAKRRGLPCDRPFEVHLPTKMEPWFSVRDFGVGMDVEDLNTVYTTYFESTKIESNDYVGCLGLGSKSPFCYTDVFTVESVCDGIRHIAVCSVSNGIPQFSLMSSEPSDAPNGVLVKFAVESSDFNAFKNHAMNIYARFQHRPKIVNDQSFKFHDYEVRKQGTGWKLLKECDIGSHVIMGNIAYPIRESNLIKDRNALSSDAAEAKQINIVVNALLESDVSITFDIGQLEIAANRESLHFDDRTRKNIILALKNIFNEIVDEFITELKKETSLWRQICKWKDLSEELCANQGYYSRANTLFRAIEECPRIVREFGSSLRYSSVDLLETVLSDLTKEEKEKFELVSYQYKPSLISRSKRVVGSSVTCGSSSKIVRTDTKKAFVGKIKQYILDNQSTVRNVYVLPDDSELEKKIVNGLGLSEADIINVSTLRSPERNSVATTNRKKTSRTLLQFAENNSSWNVRHNWYDVVVDDITDDEYFYIETSRGHIVPKGLGKSGSLQFSYLQRLIDLAKKFNFIDKGFTLYGVPQHKSSPIIKNDNWIEFTEFCREKFTEMLTSIPNIKRRIESFNQVRTGEISVSIEQVGRLDRFMAMTKSSDLISNDFSELVDLRNEFLASTRKDTDIVSLYNSLIDIGLKIDLDNAKVVNGTFISGTEIRDKYASLMKNYPMFELLPSTFDFGSKIHQQTILDYIMLIEKN